MPCSFRQFHCEQTGHKMEQTLIIITASNCRQTQKIHVCIPNPLVKEHREAKEAKIEMDMHFGNLEKSYYNIFQIQYNSHEMVIDNAQNQPYFFYGQDFTKKSNFTLLFSSLGLIIYLSCTSNSIT